MNWLLMGAIFSWSYTGLFLVSWFGAASKDAVIPVWFTIGELIAIAYLVTYYVS